MLLLLRVVTALALAAWFGGMLFFGMGVAPVAFGVLPDRVLAGNVVNGSMAKLHMLAYVAAGLALFAFAVRSTIEPAALRLITGFKAILVVLMLGLTLFSGMWLSPTLAEMRQTHGAIDQLPAGDPIKDRFGALHRLSVTVMGVTMVGVLAVIVLEQVRGREA